MTDDGYDGSASDYETDVRNTLDELRDEGVTGDDVTMRVIAGRIIRGEITVKDVLDELGAPEGICPHAETHIEFKYGTPWRVCSRCGAPFGKVDERELARFRAGIAFEAERMREKASDL